MQRLIRLLVPAALLWLGLATDLPAQVLRLTLGQMTERTDGAVVGTIKKKKVTHLEETKDGPDLFFTTLTIEGRNLASGKEETIEVSFPGGFVDERTGVWNSEAPSSEDQRLGNQVLAFWKQCPDLGGGFSGNALYTSHGGLYRIFRDRRGRDVVLGRGEGYAIDFNRRLTDLEQEYGPLFRAEEQRRKEAEKSQAPAHQ